MVHFSANFRCNKTAFHLVCKPLLFPWVNRSSRIAYTKGRDLSSSLPLRYVPNKLSEDKKPIASSVRKKTFEDANLPLLRSDAQVEKGKGKWPNPIHNGHREQLRMKHPRDASARHNEPNLFLDEQEALSSFDPCVPSGEEEEPDELSEEHQCNLMDPSHGKYQTQASGNRPDAERLAIQLLSRRAFTASELRRKLQGKNFPLDIVDAVVADFQNRGYINDCLYAETFSRSRFSSSCWGPKRIKEALFKKGVSKLDIEDAVKLVFEEDESVEDPELVVGYSKLPMNHLLVQASKQWLRNQKVSSEKRKSRLIQWLQYRGYNWNVISFVLKKLESGYVP